MALLFWRSGLLSGQLEDPLRGHNLAKNCGFPSSPPQAPAPPPKGHWGVLWQWGAFLLCPGKLFCGQVVDFLTPAATHEDRNAAMTSDSGS